MSDLVKWARNGLRQANAALNKGEKPGAFVKRFGELSDAQKREVLAGVPGFVEAYMRIAGRIRELNAARALAKEVRG